MPRIDRSPIKEGDIFTRLTVIKPDREKYFLCQCSCGKTKSIRRDHLKTGKTTSCGCIRDESTLSRTSNLHKANITHGASKTRLHNIWLGIKQRCYNPNNHAYSYYGGRGITLCERWHDFTNFLADMGHPEPGMTLDRINSNGGYSPDNCRWATRKAQMLNTRRNRTITHNGVTKTISQWSEITGIHRNTIDARIKAGWSTDSIIETSPLRRKTQGSPSK